VVSTLVILFFYFLNNPISRTIVNYVFQLDDTTMAVSFSVYNSIRIDELQLPPVKHNANHTS